MLERMFDVKAIAPGDVPPAPNTGTPGMTETHSSPTDAAAAAEPTHQLPYAAEQIAKARRCIDVGLLRRRLSAEGLCHPSEADDAVLRAYLTRPECSHVSPNPLFDEMWYRARYPDVAAVVAAGAGPAFFHYLAHGLTESRWPNETMAIAGGGARVPLPSCSSIEGERYLELNPAARAFVDAFPIVSALEHYNLYGRFMHFRLAVLEPAAPDLRSALVALLQGEFDPHYYASRYLSDGTSADLADPFAHYLRVGIERAYSPAAWFEEDWYRAFYPDVRAAIPREVTCGFHHYLTRGRSEQRLPRFDLTSALERQMPGVTAPALIPRVDALRTRLFTRLRAHRRGADESPTTWFLLPTVNPDISFGGYLAAFELIRALRATGRRVAIYCTEDARANKGYFLWRERSEGLRDAFAEVEVLGRGEDDRIGIGPRDHVVVYTVWDLPSAAMLAEWTDFGKPYLLAQEYEPIFFDNSSTKALCAETYEVPHFPIVSSPQLLRYFRERAIGAFADGPGAEASDYAVYEHRINQLKRQSASSMQARKRRVFAVYARPELHAARNLFELTLLALQDLCARGTFGPEWSFVGLGALSDIAPLDLGGGHRLVLLKRTSEAEYRELLQSLDIGLSLMYAPHPGLVALEFATTGALAITNVYENRSAADLRSLSANLVPCEPTLRDLQRAIEESLRRVGDYEERERNAYVPPPQGWDEIFSREFVERVFRLDA
jgi:hypothetical protein